MERLKEVLIPGLPDVLGGKRNKLHSFPGLDDDLAAALGVAKNYDRWKRDHSKKQPTDLNKNVSSHKKVKTKPQTYLI